MSLRQLATALSHLQPSLVTQGSNQYPFLIKTQGSAGEHRSAELYKPVCVMTPVITLRLELQGQNYHSCSLSLLGL